MDDNRFLPPVITSHILSKLSGGNYVESHRGNTWFEIHDRGEWDCTVAESDIERIANETFASPFRIEDGFGWPQYPLYADQFKSAKRITILSRAHTILADLKEPHIGFGIGIEGGEIRIQHVDEYAEFAIAYFGVFHSQSSK
jgi:hypothetical protein